MTSIQPEIRLRVVIEFPERPCIGVVAYLAARPQSLLVHIVPHVTLVAFRTCTFEERGKMALFTGDHGMHADQREARHVMLEPYFLRPALHTMTACAFFTQLSIVHVVVSVTVDAAAAECFIAQFTAVACTAQQGRVFSRQRKFRITVVVKPDLSPAFRVMTGLALPAILALVFIVITVT